MNTLDVGEVATISSRWWESDLTPVEPTDITLTITKPDGTITTGVKLGMTGSESGVEPGTLDVWTYLQACDQQGTWTYQWTGTVTGATVTQEVQSFLVGLGAELVGQPCAPWCTWDEVETCSTVNFSTVGPAVRENILDVVSGLLFDLTRRRYTGICETTRSLCYSCGSALWEWPSWVHFDWAPGSWLWNTWNCQQHDEIDLGGRLPIWSVWNVVVNGETVDPSLYTLVRRRFLSRTDETLWPSASDITDPTAFRATWAYGLPVPPGGRMAAAQMAAEMAAACVGEACQLPQRISSIIREGVTYPVIDSLSMVKEGRTGLYLADLWIEADRQGTKSRSGIFVPAAAHRRTSP